MFMAALFIIVKKWKQHKCLSADEWINKMYISKLESVEYYSRQRNRILVLVTTLMNLKDIMKEARHERPHIVCFIYMKYVDRQSI